MHSFAVRVTLAERGRFLKVGAGLGIPRLADEMRRCPDGA